MRKLRTGTSRSLDFLLRTGVGWCRWEICVPDSQKAGKGPQVLHYREADCRGMLDASLLEPLITLSCIFIALENVLVSNISSNMALGLFVDAWGFLFLPHPSRSLASSRACRFFFVLYICKCSTGLVQKIKENWFRLVTLIKYAFICCSRFPIWGPLSTRLLGSTATGRLLTEHMEGTCQALQYVNGMFWSFLWNIHLEDVFLLVLSQEFESDTGIYGPYLSPSLYILGRLIAVCEGWIILDSSSRVNWVIKCVCYSIHSMAKETHLTILDYCSIIRAFLVEEQKIVKKVLKIQKSKEKLAAKAQS